MENSYLVDMNFLIGIFAVPTKKDLVVVIIRDLIYMGK